MKIAFVDNLAVGGGLSRFSYKLCESLIDFDENISIDYYVHELNLKRTPELKELSSRVTIKILETTIGRVKLQNTSFSFFKRVLSKVICRLERIVRNDKFNNDTIKEIEEKIIGYDVAYFPAAHMMQRPKLSVPQVGTIHDFNWKYFLVDKFLLLLL